MRLDRLFVLFFSIILVSVSLFYFPSSSQESICRDGEIFNPELSRCEASPLCPDGTSFNPDSDRCEQVPQCPTNLVYNKDRDKCEDLDPCPDGTLDSDGCTTDPELDCNFDTVNGFLNSNNICEIPIIPNNMCLGDFYFSRDRCMFPTSFTTLGYQACVNGVEPKRPLCPSGMRLFEAALADPAVCRSNPCDEGVFSCGADTCVVNICDAGGYDFVNHRCQEVIIGACPSNLPNRDLAVCWREANCGIGQVRLHLGLFTCDDGPPNSCPFGSVLKKEGVICECEAAPKCLSGTNGIVFNLHENEIFDSKKICAGGVGTFNPNSRCPDSFATECLINGVPARDVCEEEPNLKCPEGAKLTNGNCVDSTPCLDGFDLVDSGGNSICEGPATCPVDTALDTSEDLCLAEFECPEDTIFDANTDLCIRLIVSIDIKPGSDLNCFNNNGKGVIPVAILGSDLFDVTLVDPATVQLDGMGIKQVGKGNKLLASIEDTNKDGFDDLSVKIQDQDGIFSEDGTGTLTGELFDKTPFEGTDPVCIRPPSDKQTSDIVTDNSDVQTDTASFDTETSDNLAPDIVTDDDFVNYCKNPNIPVGVLKGN